MNRVEFKNLMYEAGFNDETLAKELNKAIKTVNIWGFKNKPVPIEVIKFLTTKVELDSKKLIEKENRDLINQKNDWHTLAFIKDRQVVMLETFIAFKGLRDDLIQYLELRDFYDRESNAIADKYNIYTHPIIDSYYPNRLMELEKN
jgi:hypothetical protein